MYFVALEIKAGETEKDVVRAFLSFAAMSEVKCSYVDVYGLANIQSIPFVRFVTDAQIHRVESYLMNSDRSYIFPDGHGFRLMFEGEELRTSATAMLGAKLPGYTQHKYYGTIYPGWESQF